MKQVNIAKRALACGLAVAMVLTSGNYSGLTVTAEAKAKAKLSKSKVSVIAGSTTTLKVKKATKKVKWSTSNKKVVKITKISGGKKKTSATILGVKKGSAVVTAKVGSKKLKCKVSVQANQVAAVSVDSLDYSALTVKLSKKKALNAGDVKIAVKDYKTGTYNTAPKVEGLSTTDQKTYRLYLTSGVGLNDYVKVTIGKYSKEVQNKQTFYAEDEAVTVLLEKDVTVMGASLSEYFKQGVGNVAYALKSGDKLPAGLTLVGKRGIIKGIPTEAGVTTTTIKATDEAGRTAKLTFTFKVYDESTIAAADSLDNEIKLDDYLSALTASMQATPAPTVAPTPAPTLDPDYGDYYTQTPVQTMPAATATAKTEIYYTAYQISPMGGSGSYKYDLVQNGTNDPVSLSTDVTDAAGQVQKKAAASTSLRVKFGMTEGVHTYTINITDAADTTRTTAITVSINVKANYNISGTVQDAFGNPLSGNEAIYFYPEDAKNGSDVETRRTYSTYQKKEGSYSYNNYIKVAGNHHDSYYYSDSYSVSCENGDKYDVYLQDYYTSQVGPYPIPTILTAEPTPSPTAAAEQPAATPTATPFKVPDLAAGNYEAEVPAGTYTVKVRGNNGVKYQLADKVTIATDAVGTTNLVLPVRFANITATAKYANDKPVANDEVFFETDNTQYEGYTFHAYTNYLGSFTASLPAGNYRLYWIDENGQRQYFENTLTVADGTDANVGDVKLAVSRFEVSGSFRVHGYDDNGQETDILRGGAALYFFDANGNVKTAYTQYDRSWDSANSKYVDGTKHGTFDKLMLDNGTYTVRYKGTYGMSTIGTVTVNGLDVKQDFIYNAKTSIENEFNTAAALTLEQESLFSSTGNNDILVKFTVPAAAEGTSSYNAYDIDMRMNGTQTLSGNVAIELCEETVEIDTTKSYELIESLSIDDNTVYLASGRTYMLRLTPIDTTYSYDIKQLIGTIKVKVAKSLEAYEKSATPLTLGTAATVVCAENVKDSDFVDCVYLKVAVEEGKTYKFTYASKTIGASDIEVSPVSGNLYKTTVYGNDSVSNVAGAGTVYFKASTTGDAYIRVSADERISTTVDVLMTEYTSQSPIDTPTYPPVSTPTAGPSTGSAID